MKYVKILCIITLFCWVISSALVLILLKVMTDLDISKINYFNLLIKMAPYIAIMVTLIAGSFLGKQNFAKRNKNVN